MTSFTITTEDQIIIQAIANAPSTVSGGLLCFHMMPATKESYAPILEAVSKKNILAWAIDFRGHGESTNNGKLDYHGFSDLDHQNYILDARAAYREMKKSITPSIVIGASIGANIALQLQVEFSIPRSILLSPGQDYRGVQTLPSAAKLTEDQSCLIIASNEIKQSGKSTKDEAETIYKTVSTPQKEIKIYANTAHGTQILDVDATAFDEVIKFITS